MLYNPRMKPPEDSPGDNGGRVVTRDFVLLSIAGFLFIGSLYILIPVLPLYMEQAAGATTTQVGLLVGCLTFASFLFRPLVGNRSDRYGRKPLMAIGALVFVVSSLLYIVTRSLVSLPFLLFFHGTGIACFHTASLTFAGDISPVSHRGRAQAWFQSSFNLGIMLGPLLGEFLNNRFGYNAVFVSSSIVAGLCFATVVLISEKRAEEIEWVSGSPSLGSKKRLLVLVSVAIFAGTIPIGAFETFLPLFAEARDISDFAFFFTIFAGVLILLRLFAGSLPDRVGRRVTVLASLLTVSASMVTLSFTEGFGLLSVSAVVFGAGFAFLSPALSAILVDRVQGESLGGAFGFYTMAFEGGIAFGAVLLGPVITLLDYSWAFRVVGMLALAGAVFFTAAYGPMTGPAPEEHITC